MTSSPFVAGIDGCRAGWLMVRLPVGPSGNDPARAEVVVAPSWTGLPLAGTAMVAVDMPIGLPDSGKRGCDFEARALLPAKRRSSVFLYLRRPLLGFADYAAANTWAKADCKGISKQAWNILPRIAEIDAWITPRRQARIRECHPELVFQHMNGGGGIAPKKTPQGQRARRRLLHAQGLRLDGLARRFRPREAALDDLYDAAALALAALRFAKGEGTRLSAPSRDARGLKMEIWY